MKLTYRQARDLAGLSQKQLSEMTGKSITAIVSYEKYERYPDTRFLCAFCEACKCDIDSIILVP